MPTVIRPPTVFEFRIQQLNPRISLAYCDDRVCVIISIYIYIYIYIYIFAVALRPNAGHGLLILEVSRSHTTTHHIR